MEIAVIGLNHDSAPIEIREKLSFRDSKKIEGINYFLDNGVKEAIILSTCNRSEIYIVDNNNKINEKINLVKKYYREAFNIDDVNKYLFVKLGEEAIYHTYYVASGLDSIVLGEDQILGQVKDAHLFSLDLGGSGKILNKLFREAITIAKNIKSQLKISEHPLSISYIGVKFLKDKIGDLKGKKALVLGTGKMGGLALEYLIEEELEDIFVVNRSMKKRESLLKKFPLLKFVDYNDRYSLLNDVDILITATAAPHSIIRYDEMPKLNKPLYIMDMALPRDVDKELEKLDYVSLYDIDSLKEISKENEKKRKELSLKAKEIIKENVYEFLEWIKTVKVDPIIKDINEMCRDIEKDTLDILYKKLDLDSRDKKILEKMLNSALRRVMRNPIIKLKETKDEEIIDMYITALEDLFDLKGS